MLNSDRLRAVLSYDPETGVFVRLRTGRPVAGRPNKGGYLRIFVDGRLYYAHRLAWLYVTGKWPQPEIDHCNGEKTDNRFVNLREATSSQNKFSRTLPVNRSGHRGVRRHRGRWQAVIGFCGRCVPLGTFDTPGEAAAMYQRRATELFGEFTDAT